MIPFLFKYIFISNNYNQCAPQIRGLAVKLFWFYGNVFSENIHYGIRYYLTNFVRIFILKSFRPMDIFLSNTISVTCNISVCRILYEKIEVEVPSHLAKNWIENILHASSSSSLLRVHVISGRKTLIRVLRFEYFFEKTHLKYHYNIFNCILDVNSFSITI